MLWSVLSSPILKMSSKDPRLNIGKNKPGLYNLKVCTKNHNHRSWQSFVKNVLRSTQLGNSHNSCHFQTTLTIVVVRSEHREVAHWIQQQPQYCHEPLILLEAKKQNKNKKNSIICQNQQPEKSEEFLTVLLKPLDMMVPLWGARVSVRVKVV